jgi:hypothetical protein
MTQETETRPVVEPASDSGELTDAELTYVVGGVGTEGSIEDSGKATPILF